MFELFTEVSREDSIGDVMEIKVDELVDFSEEIFSPYEGMRRAEMIESVKAYGIITPIIVREYEGGYEILSGHNRVRAARAIGMETVPALSRGVISDDEARFIVTESNIVQRGFMELTLLERAHCIAVRHEAMKQQGLRTDVIRMIENEKENPGDVEEKDTNKLLADSFDLSPRSVRRYVRLHSLSDGLKALVDQDMIGVRAGVDLSYLEVDHQELVAEVAVEFRVKISPRDADSLRDFEEAGEFTREGIIGILVKESRAKTMKVVLSRDIMDRFFDGLDEEAIHDILEQALESWFAGIPKVS